MRIAGLERIIVLAAAFALAFALSGCASSGGSTTESSSSGSSGGSSGSSSSAPAAKTTPANVPAGSPLAGVEIGMTQQQVVDLLGQPTRMKNYPTGKNWIPFYFGGDTYRFDWIYPGKGTVIMANTSRFSSNLVVADVLHDPAIE